MSRANVPLWAALAAAVVAVSIGAGVSVNAQPCCMWCPNGASLYQNFNNASTSSDTNVANAKANPNAVSVMPVRLNSRLNSLNSRAAAPEVVRARVHTAGTGTGAGCTQGVVQFFVMYINVPPVPLTFDPSIVSTIFSQVDMTWGGDQWTVVGVLDLDETNQYWTAVAQIRNGGNVVAAGTTVRAKPGSQVEVNVALPNNSPAAYTQVVVDSADYGNSIARINGPYTNFPDATDWNIGWAWQGVTPGTTSCSVFPNVPSVRLTEVKAQDCQGYVVPLNLTNSWSLQSFCNLAVAASMDGFGFTTVTFTFDST